MSVSFDLDLGEAIRNAAAAHGQSVSAWIAEAARDRLRLEALGQAVASWEDKFGPLSDAELEAAGGLLAGPARGRRRGAA